MQTMTLNPTADPAVTLTCYLHGQSPEMPNTNLRPAVLVLPGGGYQSCSDREAEPVALAYMAEGYNTFVLRYTVGGGADFPRPLQDAEAAMDSILAHAAEWHTDTERIAVIGFSAGGHLAAALGTMGRVRPAALVLCYPCILDSMAAVLGRDIPSLEKHVDAQTPPAFLFATSADELVPVQNTLAFAGALAEQGIPFETHIYRQGRHGLSLAKPLTCSGYSSMTDARAAGWFPLSMDWLHGLWGDFPAEGVLA